MSQTIFIPEPDEVFSENANRVTPQMVNIPIKPLSGVRLRRAEAYGWTDVTLNPDQDTPESNH